MTIQQYEYCSASSLQAAALEAAQRAQAQGRFASIVVGTTSATQDWKEALAGSLPLGVGIQAFQHWLEGLWELYGDERCIVTSAQRRMILRPLLAQSLSLDPSSKYVRHLASFVANAAGLDWGGTALSNSDVLVKSLVASYEKRLADLGLVEPLQAVTELVNGGVSGWTFIVHQEALSHPWRERALELFSHKNEVVVLGRALGANQQAKASSNELSELCGMLFSGKGGLRPQGRVEFVRIQGSHCHHQAVASMVRDLASQFSGVEGIALITTGSPSVQERLFSLLQEEGISFQARYSQSLKSTCFGGALLNLLQARSCLEQEGEYDDEACAQALRSFVATPYSGLNPSVSSAMQMRWRHDCADARECFESLKRGFSADVGKKTWAQLLSGAASLVAEDSSIETIALAMRSNSLGANLGDGRLEDDAAALRTVMEYLNSASSLGLVPSPVEMADLPVVQKRSFGEGPFLQIADANTACNHKWKGLILGSLDAQAFSMAPSSSPFDSLAQKIGVAKAKDKAVDQRLFLLETLEHVSDKAVFYVVGTNNKGDEQCASALWDELLAAYAPDTQEDWGSQETFDWLQGMGHARSYFEGDFFVEEAPRASSFQMSRGELRRQAAVDLLPMDYEEHGETFSPTALEDYYRCPYRWFICRRIGASTLDGDFSPLVLGNLAHAVLDRFYRLFVIEGAQPRVTPDNLPQALSLLDDVFTWQKQHEIERHRLIIKTRRDELQCDEVLNQLRSLIVRDASFLPGFFPRYLELELKDPDSQPLEYAGVKVKGKVDRIDVNDQGQAVIIDYKLSKLSNGYGFKRGESYPARIQTDIYASLVQRYFFQRDQEIEVVGSVYRSYAINAMRGAYSRSLEWGDLEWTRSDLDAFPNEGRSLSYGHYLKAVEELVAQSMQDLSKGVIVPRPLDKGACEHCLAQAFCKEAC